MTNSQKQLLQVLGVGTLATAMLLTACQARANDTEKGRVETVPLEDGRSIQCVFYSEGRALNGMDCDWGTLK